MIANHKRLYKIIAVPLFGDNYSYIIHGTSQNKLVLVDPANPTVIGAYLKDNFPQYQVSHVLYTHKHWDHAGQSLLLKQTLKESNPAIQLLIGQKDRQFVEGATYSIKQDQELVIGNSKIKTLHVPCHTKGHTIYNFLALDAQVGEKEFQYSLKQTIQGKKVREFVSPSCIFTGDTLFVGGMGRFFQGNAQQMAINVKNIYTKFDLDSHMYCGHQYTLQNLKWAAQVEKTNKKLVEYLQKLQTEFAQKGEICSIPSSLRFERQINLFIRAITGNEFPADFTNNGLLALRTLRQMKNQNLTQFPILNKSQL